MAITFPANPSLNDTFTSGGKTFQWNGTSWTVNQEANILTDTTPQLGGNLDLNSQDITGTGDINVTGTITATSFSGDGSALTGAGTTTTAEWTLGADGSNHYTFTGPGVADGTTDPTIYLTRGQTYKFKNRSGGHPFRIQYEFQNTGGTAYNDGITNNAAGNGTDLYWEVRNDTPDVLYYQCTSHTNMSGRINMISGENKSIGVGTESVAGRNAGISTATGTVIYIPSVGLQVYAGDGAGWKTVADTSSFSASGGTVTTDGIYTVHTFTSTGTFNFTMDGASKTIDYLVVAGGGGNSSSPQGGNRESGSGAGGLLSSHPDVPAPLRGSSVALSPGTYTVVVGGGAGGQAQGSPSSISFPTPITTTGGGRGANQDGQIGGPGGSGGGNWYASGNTPGQGIAGQGNPGGIWGGPNNWIGGGGGGAGAAGGNGATTRPAGLTIGITGGAVEYARGGASNSYPSTPRNSPGAANSGEGASGVGNGGSGIVVIRYET